MKKDTILFDLLQRLITEEEVKSIFESHGYEDTARKFGVFSLLQFWIAVAWGEWKSFRESEEQLKGRPGLVAVDYTTLSRKASRIPFEGFQDLFHQLVKRCPRRIRRMLSLPFFVLAVDSTIITVGKNRLPWAHFRESRSGVKLHVRLDVATGAPVQAEASPARDHDLTVVSRLPQTPQTVTVEDRGYVDMERMDLLHESGRFFVIRLRKNMERRAWKSLRRLQTIDSPVLEDGTCFIGKAKNRFRVVSFRDAKGRTIHVVTNLMHVSAEVIAELYKARWQVELFFRWIKQHLNVKRLFGTTPNAVYGQLFGACIAYVLLHWLYTREKSRRFQDVSLLQFARQLWLSQLPAEWVLCLFDHLHRLGARTCYLC
jgi:hypothetical protein